MKKYLSLLLALTLIFSLASVNAFAKEAEVTVFTQDFEKNNEGDDTAKWETTSTYDYANGDRFRHTDKSSYSTYVTEGDNSYIVTGENGNSKGGQITAIVIPDPKCFVVGERYKVVYDAKLTTDATGTEASITFRLNGVTINNNTIAVNTWVRNIETDVFTFNSDSTHVRFRAPNSNTTTTYEEFAIDNVRFVKVNYLDDVTADAGYYADEKGGEATSGEIAINTKVIYDAENIDGYGFYVYRQDDETITETVTSTDIDSLVANGNEFNAIIEEIGAQYFDTNVCVKPFVIIGESTIYGDTFIYSVNSAETPKWLGTK